MPTNAILTCRWEYYEISAKLFNGSNRLNSYNKSGIVLYAWRQKRPTAHIQGAGGIRTGLVVPGQALRKEIYNYAYRMGGNAADARDMLQEILMAVYRNLGSYRGEGPFPAWLFRLASFRCTDFLRRRRPQVVNSRDLDLIADEKLNQQPEQDLIGTQQNREVIRLMNVLSREQRLVVELKFFQHFTFDEIGNQLGISSNTAKTRLYSALKSMRKDTEVSIAV